MGDPVQKAIEVILNAYPEGWMAKDFVVVMGLERVNSEDRIDSAVWLYTPNSQPEYVTNGLLMEAEAMQHADHGTDDQDTD